MDCAILLRTMIGFTQLFVRAGAVLVVGFISIFFSIRAFSLETDDYLLPTVQLEESHQEMSELVWTHLESARLSTNSWMLQNGIVISDKNSTKIKKYFLKQAYAGLADGLAETGIEIELIKLASVRENIYYKSPFSQTAYFQVLSPQLQWVSRYYWYLAGTLNFYGHYFGSDKLGHFFQLGQDYYLNYLSLREERARSEDSILKEVVRMGFETEDGVYGRFASSIFSNADLAANFSGFMFIRSFFERIKLGNETLEPLYLFRVGDTRIRKNRNSGRSRVDLFNGFITAHLNESLNPNIYLEHSGLVEKLLLERCQGWLMRYQVPSKIDFRVWHGYDYGYTDLLRSNSTNAHLQKDIMARALSMDEMCRK